MLMGPAFVQIFCIVTAEFSVCNMSDGGWMKKMKKEKTKK